jgi:hypothetical protein
MERDRKITQLFVFTLIVIFVVNFILLLFKILPYTLSIPLFALFVVWVAYIIHDSQYS